ncbi:mechanosensitive ion channel family protein [Swingsia samuiensis]|uniref:Mechanosensitive ion channel family protein n=1 Tax=Swingsia samuiensis TaxID=1293412 RepID=A0A4Y6UI86_9PROT|nr:mechanosensitive ion channel family protein [Swingsia samuiensis]QDH16156.1 mechanosensitive ion channel family protein [Swingsia samuiensis]
MSQHFVSTLFAIRSYFTWLPPSIVSILMLVIVGILGFYCGNLVVALILRVPGSRSVALIRTIVSALRRPAKLLTSLLAMLAALPAATGFTYESEQDIKLFLLFVLVLTFGFSMIIVFRHMTEAYLNRLSSKDETDDIMIRTHQTQIRVLRRLTEIMVGIITVASALMLFPSVKQYGVSLFASAGAASLIVGLSARGLLTNLIAGVQIAITQPIRMEDLVIINGDWCWVEEINATYVVLRVWDWRRHIVPISYFLENQFENWTHNSAAIIGVVFLWLDYQAPMDRIREMLNEIIRTSPLWDGKVFDVQVSDCNAQVMAVRIIASARNALQSWDLRCDIREKIIARIKEECPESLPRTRFAMMPPKPGSEGLADDWFSPPIERPGPGSYMGPGTPPLGK